MSQDSEEEKTDESTSYDEEEENLPPFSTIFEGNWKDENSIQFDTITISLEGGVKSNLNWEKKRILAKEAVEKGYTLMWNLQMDLFEKLPSPLAYQPQFLALALALEHFRDTLWKEFRLHTVGLSLYRGSADFFQHFNWDIHQRENLSSWLQETPACAPFSTLSLEELQYIPEGKIFLSLFCRTVALEYLSLLSTRIPDTLPLYLFLNVESLISSGLSELQFLNPEEFDRFHLALKGARLPWRTMQWQSSLSHAYQEKACLAPKIGICIPSVQYRAPYIFQQLEQKILHLQEQSIPIKLIAESHLTAEWDGLDDLIYHPDGLSIQGKRKLQGFSAAGGNLFSIDLLHNSLCSRK